MTLLPTLIGHVETDMAIKCAFLFPILKYIIIITMSLSELCFYKVFHILQIKKQQLELDLEEPIGSKPGKEYVKAVYCHPDYLTCFQSTSCKIMGGNTSWDQDCWEKDQQPQICRWYHTKGRK